MIYDAHMDIPSVKELPLGEDKASSRTRLSTPLSSVTCSILEYKKVSSTHSCQFEKSLKANLRDKLRNSQRRLPRPHIESCGQDTS